MIKRLVKENDLNFTVDSSVIGKFLEEAKRVGEVNFAIWISKVFNEDSKNRIKEIARLIN